MSSQPEPFSGADHRSAQVDLGRLAQALASAEDQAHGLAEVARRQTEIAEDLRAENRRLHEGEVREAVAPIVRGLARLADEVGRMRTRGGPSQGDLVQIEQRLAELLHDAGVTPMSPAPGDPFDVHLHVSAGSVHTDNPLEDQTVVGVRRPGLVRDDGRVVRPAEVLVYRFDTRNSPS